jgi:hypothetical protein
MRDEAVIALVLVLVITSAGAGYYLGTSNRQTVTTTATSILTTTASLTFTTASTILSTVTSVSTYVPHGSQSMLSSATVSIPNGSTGVPLSLSFPPYSGYLLVTYNATNPVSLVWSVGATTVWTPISRTGTNLNLPIAVIPINPPPTVYVENACGLPPPEECPSVTLTITATYYY